MPLFIWSIYLSVLSSLFTLVDQHFGQLLVVPAFGRGRTLRALCARRVSHRVLRVHDDRVADDGHGHRRVEVDGDAEEDEGEDRGEDELDGGGDGLQDGVECLQEERGHDADGGVVGHDEEDPGLEGGPEVGRVEGGGELAVVGEEGEVAEDGVGVHVDVLHHDVDVVAGDRLDEVLVVHAREDGAADLEMIVWLVGMILVALCDGCVANFNAHTRIST